MGRGARTESQVRSPLRPQVGSVAGRSFPGWAARRGWLLCVGPKAGASEVAAVGAATAGRLAGAKTPGVGSVPAQAAAAAAASAARPRVSVPRGFSSWLEPPRVAAGKGRGTGARPQPTCPLARLARGSGAPGTTSRPAEMTRGLLPPKISLRSPRVRGARSTSPPPRSPPHGPAPRAGSRCARALCACVGQCAWPPPDFCRTRGPGVGWSRSRLPAPGVALGRSRAGRACAGAPGVRDPAAAAGGSLGPGVG